MMSLKELVEELQELMADEGPDLEVISVDPETGEQFTPIISVMTYKDGVRRMRI